MITIERKQPIIDEINHPAFARIQDIPLEDGTTLPCYKIGSFINTLEGNNLYAICLRNNDMKPYQEAKKEYESMKQNIELS